MCNFLFAGRFSNTNNFKIESKSTEIAFMKWHKTLCLYVDNSSFRHMGNFPHSVREGNPNKVKVELLDTKKIEHPERLVLWWLNE